MRARVSSPLTVHRSLIRRYYNHSCNDKQDAAWEQAVGYHAPNKEPFSKNLLEIVTWMGDRYRDKLKAWWFDSPYSLDARDPHNSLTTAMTGFQFPWEQFTVAAKTGHLARLVTYNAGVNQTFLYTTHQDYWAGELVNLDTPANGRYLDNGLQCFGWTCLEDRRWVHTKLDTPIPPPLCTDEQVIGYFEPAIPKSYYPQWHGTFDDLKSNLTDLAQRYEQPIIVAEYSKPSIREINDIVHELPGGKGLGTFIWEPTKWRGGALFDQQGNTSSEIDIDADMAQDYGLFETETEGASR